MKGSFSISQSSFDEMGCLVTAFLGRHASSEQGHRLEELIRQDAKACDLYLNLVFDSCTLLDWARHEDRANGPVAKSGNPNFPANLWHGTVTYLSSGWPVAYLIATVVFGMGIALAALVHVSHSTSVAHKPLPAIQTDSIVQTKTDVVGYITGMIDCKWDGYNRFCREVRLGSVYKLNSGLLEITYNTGATVLLEGPISYEVESDRAGFLSIGKLVARVEKAAVSGQRAIDSQRMNVSASSNPLIRTSGPLASVRRSSSSVCLFTIRTPNAIVRDLGTEFDVEVNPDKTSVVHVSRGVVEVSRDGSTGGLPVCERLVAGETIRFSSLNDPPERLPPRSSRAAPMPVLTTTMRQVYQARSANFLSTPSGLIATAYHRVWDATGKEIAENDRHRAFLTATNGFFGRGEANAGPVDSFDTLSGSREAHPFVGLQYRQRVRIDRIKVFLGCQMGDSGNWAEMPRVFILKNPIDTDNVPPENDPANWREINLDRLLYGASFDEKPDPNPGAVIELLLTGVPEEQRVGYGWAIGSVKADGTAHYVSITELRGYGKVLQPSN